jgi:hypothetical protein
MKPAPRWRMDLWAIDYDTALNTDPLHETASEIDLAV